MIWNPDYMKYGYEHYLAEARGMSLENLKRELEKMKNLSDDSGENISTGGMQLQYAAYQQVLEEKNEKTN